MPTTNAGYPYADGSELVKNWPAALQTLALAVGNMPIPSFTDTTARNSAMSSPSAGMFAYLTTPKHLTFHDGSSWKLLAGAGTYTPTLGAGIVVGTGGSARNAATWAYAGGILQVEGAIVLGSSGASVGASGHTMSLPANFTATSSDAPAVGDARMNAGALYLGAITLNSTTSLLLQTLNAASTNLGLTSLSSTNPGTWASGNSIYWAASVSGVMTS